MMTYTYKENIVYSINMAEGNIIPKVFKRMKEGIGRVGRLEKFKTRCISYFLQLVLHIFPSSFFFSFFYFFISINIDYSPFVIGYIWEKSYIIIFMDEKNSLIFYTEGVLIIYKFEGLMCKNIYMRIFLKCVIIKYFFREKT